MSNLEAQQNEILSLQSIYESKEFVVDNEDPPCGRLIVEVRIDPDDELFVGTNVEYFEVSHLPPIILNFRFPETYPSETCPAFLLSCSWLSLSFISELCRKLENIWENNKDAILYLWMQFLQEETLNFLKINGILRIYESENRLCARKQGISDSAEQLPSVFGGDGIIDLRAVNDFSLTGSDILNQMLKDYDSLKKKEVFDNTFQECNVCLLGVKGSEIFKFESCEHYFCKSCVREYFETQIKDGNVTMLKCLHGDCNTEATQAAIKNLIDADLYIKYDRLLLSAALESMSDIAYCPRKRCQCACIIDTCGRLATCSKCCFAFCPFCNMTYHGIAPCNNNSEVRKRIYAKYAKAKREDRLRLQKQVGKRELQSLVEDTLSEEWKNANSKQCPRCHSSIEKDFGCNKMICFRCGTFFCWLCNRKLKSENPYAHYSDPRSECFNQLYPEEFLDQFNDDLEPEQAEPGAYLPHLHPEIVILG